MEQQINILMLGGKRCGKTTVLASMYSEINKAVAGTSLKMETTGETAEELRQAKEVIENRMKDFKEPLSRVDVDEGPTSAEKCYSFQLCLENRRIPFHIYDIPGEWLTDQSEQCKRRISELIRECPVIMIAIDTPYLFSKMTDKGYGAYHEEYNKPIEITNFFKNSLSVENIRDRMILFVPIKCERYYHLTNTPQLNRSGRDYMNEIVDAIGQGYSDLLMYLKSTPALINSCTIAITPILSAGGIDFVLFHEDKETGKMVSLYQEPEFLDRSEQGYSPKFCEQPMLYALIYILMQEQQKASEQNTARLFQNTDQYQISAVINTLRKKIKRNTGALSNEGFYFIQNPKDI